MTGSDDSALGAFLMARRAEITPAMAGLAEDGTRRRVPGLRRDEVARLAVMSVDYYTRIEQGRLRPSPAVLASLVRALRLDESQTSYLYEVAGRPRTHERRAEQRIRPAVHRMLASLGHYPAFVLGRFNDILAWNDAAAALFQDFALLSAAERNYTRLLFLDPRSRDLFVDWEDACRLSAARLRMDTAGHPDDPRLQALVGELSVRSENFRQWWTGHVVSDTSAGRKRFRHAALGELTLDCDTWANPDDPELMIVVYSAEPGTREDDALRILASWTREASDDQRS